MSLPELGPLWKRKRRQSGPTTSIVKGRYRHEDTVYHRQPGYTFSTVISNGNKRLEGDPYIELQDVGIHRISALVGGNQKGQDEQEMCPGRSGIGVTQEFRIDSSRVI